MSSKFVPNGLIDYNPEFVLHNSLAPDRQQAIIWTNDGQIHWYIYASLALSELTIVIICRWKLEIHVYIFTQQVWVKNLPNNWSKSQKIDKFTNENYSLTIWNNIQYATINAKCFSLYKIFRN